MVHLAQDGYLSPEVTKGDAVADLEQLDGHVCAVEGGAADNPKLSLPCRAGDDFESEELEHRRHGGAEQNEARAGEQERIQAPHSGVPPSTSCMTRSLGSISQVS